MDKFELEQVKEFHKKFDMPIRGVNKKLKSISKKEIDLRKDLIVEEVKETLEAIQQSDVIGIADGCVDTMYVITGAVIQLGLDPSKQLDLAAVDILEEQLFRVMECFSNEDLFPDLERELIKLEIVAKGVACVFGIPYKEVFTEVHRSNMSKLWDDGKVHKDERGKVIKPATYSPADIESIIYDEEEKKTA